MHHTSTAIELVSLSISSFGMPCLPKSAFSGSPGTCLLDCVECDRCRLDRYGPCDAALRQLALATGIPAVSISLGVH